MPTISTDSLNNRGIQWNAVLDSKKNWDLFTYSELQQEMLLKYKGHYPGRFSKSSYGCLETGQMKQNQSRFTKSSLFQGLQYGNSVGKMGRWLSKQNHIRPQGNQKYSYFENYSLKKPQQTNKQKTPTRNRGLCYKDLNCVEEMLKWISGQVKHNHTQKNLIFEFSFGTILGY